MDVAGQDLRSAVRALDLGGRPVCVHSSLRSFGRVEGGARAVVRAFLEEGCTVLAPTFSSAFAVEPPTHLRFERNGWDYVRGSGPCPGAGRIYTPETAEIDHDMGAIPAALLVHPGRVRGRHPLDSFTAAGPLAAELIWTQSPSEPYAPLGALASAGGFVLLMGVGFERMTLLHLAEKEAGRALFRRWANDARGEPRAVEVGGCSEGFGKLGPQLRAVTRQTTVGQSAWRLLPAAEALSLAAAAIRAEPRVTHCGRAECERCDDAVAGGPVL